ncbi:MAG: hypothetical protein HKN61_06705, partial [Flavobacteriaceae bacterium]|nr:hypothetical protein [Flavobacteriaceae bacterium]
MLQRYLPVLFVLGCMLTGSAQIKIGENPQNIHPASVLELESNNRALVITRVNTQEMNAIVPLQGAMVYNNDTQCIHFYDGNGWLNLCDALGLSFSTDPVVNPAETIVITETEGNRNFEVGQITGMNIVDFSIGGAKLQNNSITANKLAANSVGSEELQDNTVTDEEIDYNVVTLNDFLNDANFITGADIVSGAANNSITDNGGAFFDATPLQNSITTNTNNLDNHIAADGDTSDTNELQNLTSATFNPATSELTINIENGASTSVLLGDLADPGTDDQNLGPGNFNPATNTLTIEIEDGNPVDIDLSALAGTGTDDQNLGPASFNPSNNILTIDIEGGNSTQVDLTPLSATGSDNQDLDNVLGQGNDAGGQPILNIVDNASPSSVVTKAYVDAQVGGGGSTELADQVTIVGDGTSGNEFEVADAGITTDKIAPGAADQILRTDPTGTSVAWVNLPPGGGTTEEADQITITGIGTNADPFKIEPSTVNGQFLRTDPTTGNVIWDDLPAGTGGAVSSDDITISGDGVATDLQVKDNGITSLQIADGTISTVDLGVDQIAAINLNPDVAGNGITQNAVGALEVDPSTITGNG